MKIGKWILICTGNGTNAGKMVSKPGSQSSYTPALQSARIFSSKEEAEQEACGNEYAREVEL